MYNEETFSEIDKGSQLGMTSPQIVVLDYKSIGQGLDLSGLASLGRLTVYDYTDEGQLMDHLEAAQIAITNKCQFDNALLSQLPNLRLICVTGTGFNNVDLLGARQYGIGVCNVVDYCTDSVAQHTFAMLFTLMNKIPFYQRYVSEGSYIGDADFSHYQVSYSQLKGKTFGIIGMGTIGRRVAQIATCFGAKVIYTSTTGKNIQADYERYPLEALLELSDVVSIHAPLNARTESLINVSNISRMKKDAILLNLGRGAIISEEAVVRALSMNLVAGIGLDVLTQEPMSVGSQLIPYLKDPRLLITPHIAWASIEARQKVLDEVKLNIEDYLIGNLRNRVDRLV